MPFLNRCGYMSNTELRSASVSIRSSARILVPGEGYDGFNKITIPAYPEYLQHKIIINVSKGGSGDSSPDNDSYVAPAGTAFTNIPNSIVLKEPYTNPDLIIINPITSSGSTQFFPIDSNANTYGDEGIISITAQLANRETGRYRSFITLKSGYIYTSGDSNILKSEQSIITASTNEWRYNLDLVNNSLTISMKDNPTREDLPGFVRQFGVSNVSFPTCYAIANYYAYNYKNNPAVNISYSALFFWNIHSNIITT